MTNYPVEWSQLEDALKSGDAAGVQHAIDEIWHVRDATLAGHILIFFEFESPHLTPRAKDRCAAFLREWGNEFTHFYARHVATELRAGTYLKA